MAHCAWITAHSETIPYPYPNQIGPEKRAISRTAKEAALAPQPRPTPFDVDA